jgi:hypothetical protein
VAFPFQAAPSSKKARSPKPQVLRRHGLTDMALLERFPFAWCPICEKLQPLNLEVLQADDKNDHDAADIMCRACMSVLVSLHAPRPH